MNILVLSWRDPRHPLAGGAEQVMREHMKGWIKAGHTVTLFSSKMPLLKNQEILDGIKIIRKGYQYWGVQFAGFLYYIKNRNKFDLIIDQFHGIPFFTPLYVRKPILAVIQELTREVWFTNPLVWPLNWIVGIIGYFGEPFLFLLFYKHVPFMTGSASAKSELIKMGIPEQNITIIPHGVLIEKSKPLTQKESIPTLVYLGVISKDKGIEDAIKCFALLSRNRMYNFWVIGKPETNEYKSHIDKVVKDSGMVGKIKFWGFVSHKKKFDLLSRAHLLINPSIREGWGLVNIEANAVRTPVIAYSSAGLIDSIKHGVSGCIVFTNSPSALAQEVIEILQDEDKYNQLSLSSSDWSKNFSWKISIKQSLTLVCKIAKLNQNESR